MENKVLIINTKENKEKHLDTIKAIEQYKYVQNQIKAFKEMEKVLKEHFKKYDFEKIIILDENNENITFSITQYTQERKELNEENLLDSLEDYIRHDFAMNDMIIDHQIQLRDELGYILDKSYETKEIKCVKFNIK